MFENFFLLLFTFVNHLFSSLYHQIILKIGAIHRFVVVVVVGDTFEFLNHIHIYHTHTHIPQINCRDLAHTAQSDL